MQHEWGDYKVADNAVVGIPRKETQLCRSWSQTGSQYLIWALKIRVWSGIKWIELGPVDTVLKHRISTKRVNILDSWATVRFRYSNLTDDSKVKSTLEQATKAQRGSRGIAPLFLLFSALDGGGWSTSRPGRFTPGKESRYPLYRRLGGPQGRSGRVRKISPPLGLDPRTVQPVASRYTDWAIPAHVVLAVVIIIIIITIIINVIIINVIIII
jgi:hypothetical protein